MTGSLAAQAPTGWTADQVRPTGSGIAPRMLACMLISTPERLAAVTPRATPSRTSKASSARVMADTLSGGDGRWSRRRGLVVVRLVGCRRGCRLADTIHGGAGTDVLFGDRDDHEVSGDEACCSMSTMCWARRATIRSREAPRRSITSTVAGATTGRCSSRAARWSATRATTPSCSGTGARYGRVRDFTKGEDKIAIEFGWPDFIGRGGGVSVWSRLAEGFASGSSRRFKLAGVGEG